MNALAAAVALAALAACGRSEPRPQPLPPAPAPSEPPPAAAPGAIPSASRQLVTVVLADWTATTAELRLWTRDPQGWHQVGPAWPGVVGNTGTAWGVGLHGAGAPADHDGPIKREGDGKSPAGVFALTRSFGYAAGPPDHAGLAYAAVDANWKCVDDPASRHYNQVLDQRTTTIDWTSAEDMRRADPLYTWVVEVAHNPARTPAAGSCIFLHVWGGPTRPTVGCTAMAEDRLAGLLTALAPEASPTLVVLPRAEYASLTTAWALPVLDI